MNSNQVDKDGRQAGLEVGEEATRLDKLPALQRLLRNLDLNNIEVLPGAVFVHRGIQ